MAHKEQKHTHEHCDHEGAMAHCKHCDVAYCTKCDKEWPTEKTIVVEKYVDKWKTIPSITWGKDADTILVDAVNKHMAHYE